jgi:hypothetical protein
MAKAHITTKDGTKITIEGTPEEVAALANKLGGGAKTDAPSEVGKKRRQKREKVKATPINLISSLIDGGFFRRPKDLAGVKIALEELGHGYPVTTLSPILLRLVRRRQLRRMKDKKRWVYTG